VHNKKKEGSQIFLGSKVLLIFFFFFEPHLFKKKKILIYFHYNFFFSQFQIEHCLQFSHNSQFSRIQQPLFLFLFGDSFIHLKEEFPSCGGKSLCKVKVIYRFAFFLIIVITFIFQLLLFFYFCYMLYLIC